MKATSTFASINCQNSSGNEENLSRISDEGRKLWNNTDSCELNILDVKVVEERQNLPIATIVRR